jgi:hypothetical protein
VACAIAAPAAASAKVIVGMSDQNAAFFSDPKFTALHIHEARLVVPWDVASSPSQRSALSDVSAWLSAASATNVSPLISFGDNHKYVPNVHQYVIAVRAFLKRFPQVHQYTAWNEPDFPWLSIARNPWLAAQYFNQLVFASRGKHNMILAGDMFMPAPQLGAYLRQYVRYLSVRPSGWALHDYRDIRARSTAQLSTFQRYTSGPIWLDETGGIERRGHWEYRNQSATAAGKDEAWLFSMLRRYPRIGYVFHYQWQAWPTAGWDSGLIDPNGRERPAYKVVAAATR